MKNPALSSRGKGAAFFYLSAMLALIVFGAPTIGLVEIPLTFFLKDRLNLSASDTAAFRFWIALPVFFSFVFGFVVDRWSPLKLGYRGHFVIFGLLTAALYAAATTAELSYYSLLWEFVVLTCSYLFIFGAWKGLLATIAQQRGMSGQMSFLWGVVGNALGLASLLIGGAISTQLESASASTAATVLFLSSSVLMILVAALGLWRTGGAYTDLRPEFHSESVFGDIVRLLKHRPIYPALLIWLMWNFAPGTGTVLQYYLSDAKNATDFQWGAFQAIFLASMMPTLLLFVLLSRRLSLRLLLWLGAIVGIPQMVPLLFIETADAALLTAIPMGLMGGIARGAFLALILRSCPPGLQATMMTLAGSTALLSSRVGNVWGSQIFDNFGGFLPAVVATVAIYALIVPALFLVPSRLIDTPDD